MGKQFLLWFLAALVVGVAFVLLGSWLHVGGLPPSWSHVLHGKPANIDSPAVQADLRANAPPPPKNILVLKPGDTVPLDYALPDLDGKPQRLATYRGQRVLLNFWATWCQPCLKEMPALAAAQKRHAGQVQIIGIAMDSPDHVRAWLEHTPVDYPIWQGLDGDEQPAITFGNTAGLLPYSVLIDTEGRIVTTHLGILDKHQLQQWLATGEEKSTPNETERLPTATR